MSVAQKWGEFLTVVSILLLAAALRLGAPGVVEFKRDEANLSQLALDFARGRSFPLLGISSSVGIPNPPISVYVFSIPYLLSSDPTVATLFVGVLNTLAVLLTYLVTRRYYGRGAALVAALTYAASPWGIIYSRKIWAQDLLPLFVLATISLSLLGFLEGKRWAQGWCLPLLCITAQIHYSALVIAVPVVYTIRAGRRRWTRAFGLSFIPALLLLLPFVAGVLQADLPDLDELQTIIAVNNDEARSVGLTDQAIRYAALTIAGTEIHSLAGPEVYQEYLASVPEVYPLFSPLAWAVFLAAAWLLIGFWRASDNRRTVDGLLLLWFLAPIGLFSITWTTIYPHYLIVMMPAAYILLGVGLNDWWSGLAPYLMARRVVFTAGGITLGAILLLQAVLWLALVDFLRTHYTPDGFGTPLEYLLPVREVLLEQPAGQVMASVDGQFVGIDHEATVWNVLLYDVPLVRFTQAGTAVLPAGKSTFLAANCQVEDSSQIYRLRSPEEGTYCIQDRIVNDPNLSPYTPLQVAARFANGATVTTYQWRMEPKPCLDLVWEISSEATKDYMFAVHFFNSHDQEIAIADGLSWAGRYWRPGDTVIRTFCLLGDQVAQQGDIVGVNIGMYTFDGINFHNVDLLDANSTPIGQIVRLEFAAS